MTRSITETDANLPSFAANASSTIEHDSKGEELSTACDASCSSIRHFQALNACEYDLTLASEDPGDR